MLRKYSEIFRTITAVVDLAIVSIAWAAAYLLRFHTDLFPPAPHDTGPANYVLAGAAMLPLWHFLLRKRGLYKARRGRPRSGEVRVLLEASTLAFLIVSAATFFGKGEISRLVVLLAWPLSTAGLVAFRLAIRVGLGNLRRRGMNRRGVLIVGTGVLARIVYDRLVEHPETGFHVVGFAGPRRAGTDPALPPVLGSYEELREVVEKRPIDQVVIALDRGDPADPLKLFSDLRHSTAAVRIAPDLLGLPTLQLGIEDLDGLPMIRLVESPLIGWNRVSKRAFDLVVSSAALVVAAPVMGVIALAIKASSPRDPVLYRHERMGLDGELFSIIKFRTMVRDAETATGPVWAVSDDARTTSLGHWLRRLSLDELPQLWNILRGEMSLVGPRPERPSFIQDFRRRLPGYMLRHKVKAGLTGWAQVNGWRGNTSIEKRLEYDIEYVQRWSLGFDIQILFMTLWRNFRDPNAY